MKNIIREVSLFFTAKARSFRWLYLSYQAKINFRRILLSVLFLPGFLAAQSGDSLQFWGKIMLNDTIELNRVEAEKNVSRIIDVILSKDDSWVQRLDTIKSISALTSPDDAFRIITWNVPLADGSYRFFGRIEFNATKKLPHTVQVLTDQPTEVSKPASKQLSIDNWFGALYYKIIRTTFKKKVYYTLLGWNGNTAFSNKKLIDVITISDNRKVSFGAPLFEETKGIKHRVIFEYAEKASMSLRYVEAEKLIVFDHLSPTLPSMEGVYEMYAPDFTTDAYKFQKGKWKLIVNYQARNEKENNPEMKKPERGLQPER